MPTPTQPLRWWQIGIIGALLLFSLQAANIAWIMADDIEARDRVMCSSLAAMAQASNARVKALETWLTTDIELQSALAALSTRAERLLRDRAVADHQRLLNRFGSVQLPD